MHETDSGSGATTSTNCSSTSDSSRCSRSTECLNENPSHGGYKNSNLKREEAEIEANISECVSTKALQDTIGNNRPEDGICEVSKIVGNHERQVTSKANGDSKKVDKLSQMDITDASNTEITDKERSPMKSNEIVKEVTDVKVQVDKASFGTLEGRIVKETSNSQIDMGSQKSIENLSKENKNSNVNEQDQGKHNFPSTEWNRKESKHTHISKKRDRELRKHTRSSSRERQQLNYRSNSKFRSRSRDRSVERRRKDRERRHAEQESNRSTKSDQNSLINTLEGKRSHAEKGKKESALDLKESLGNISERQRRTVDLLTSRTGGAYIPPAKLRLMQAEITDKSSAAYQRIAWEALKKSIHGYINKVNVDNIAIITRELLKENIVRGRGLLCRSIIQAQAASPTFTHVYAALVAIINSKFPNIGELLLKRLVIQFKRAFRRNDKSVCLSSSRFIAHLVNQRVAHEILALEILTLLVETPTDDSVEVAIAFLKEVGMKLTEVSSKGIGAIFEMLKNILHEGKLDKRVQYMIEVVFQVRKDGFKDHQSVLESLELVEEDDQFTHLLMLDEATNPEDVLNAFKFDEKYETNEDKYKGLSKEILGTDESESGNHSSESDSNANSGDSDNSEGGDDSAEKVGDIIDNTETNMIALRRTIYLTINSSLDYEECAHKLMKMQLKPGQEIELCHMFLDCCAEQRTYEKFYGLLAQRFCAINKIYIEPFEEIFKDTYQTTHRLDTNRLRNVSKFFAHLLFTDAVGWDILECIKLNEDDTTSSSRIFIKILFQELAEYMGLGKLNSKLKDEVLKESLTGLFPKDNPRDTRFAINFFTSIGLGGLTDELRQFLKNTPKSVPAINLEILAKELPPSGESSSTSTTTTDSSTSSSESSSSSSFSSSTSTTSDSSSESSRSKYRKRKLKKKNKQIKADKKTRQTKRNKKRTDESDSEVETTPKGSDGSYNRNKYYKSMEIKHKNENENNRKSIKNREVEISKRKYNSKERLGEKRKKIKRDYDREMDAREDKREREKCNDDRQSRDKIRDYSRKFHASRYSEYEEKRGKRYNDKRQHLKVNSDRNGSKEKG